MQKFIYRFFFCLFSIFIFTNSTYSQDNVLNLKSPVSPSPNAASLGKYGDIPVSTYTGIPNISIPLFEIKNRQINVPIELNYYAGGFKVSDEASWVGLGWSLNAGGVITRTKKWKDDLSSSGYYKSSNHQQPNDLQPDIFYFNFLKYTGKFIIDYSSNPSSPYVIRLIPLNDGNDIKFTLVNSQYWIAVDRDGVKYEFNAPEVQTDAMDVNFDDNGVYNATYTSSWYLTKITYPDGEEVEFQYSSGAVLEAVPTLNQTYTTVSWLNSTSCYTPTIADYSPQTIESVINVQRNSIFLKSILFPNGKIDFLTTDRVDLKTINTLQPQKLSTIVIYNKLNGSYNEIRRINLNYSYFDSNTGHSNYLAKRLKLTDITQTDSSGIEIFSKYSILYNATNLPDKDSKDMDHWGYYNGPKNNQTLLPIGSFSSRNPDENYVKAGLISDIIYPTGGRTHFDFEINDFSNLGLSLDWAPLNDAGNGVFGAGTRIKKITDFDVNNNILKQISYGYINSNAQSLSSGKIMTPIKYDEAYTILDKVIFPTPSSCMPLPGAAFISEGGTSLYSSSAIPLGAELQGCNIGYDKVTISNIDLGNDSTFVTDEYFNDALNPPPTQKYGVPYTNNNHNGLLKQKTYYININGSNLPIKKTVYEYQFSDSVATNGYVFYVDPTGKAGTWYPYNIISQWLVNSQSTEYYFNQSGNNSIIDTKSYTYDNTYRLLKKTTETNSKSEIITSTFTYPFDYSTGVYPTMVAKNIISPKINTTVTKTYNGLTSRLSSTTSDYASFTSASLLLPQSIEQLFLDSASGNKIQFNVYDGYGNILEQQKANDVKEVYLWGYNGQYPVAKIVGADFSTINSLIDTSILNNGTEAQIEMQLSSLRNYFKSNQLVQVSSYTYAPLIGLISETDPKGNVTFYEYDDLGRLIDVKDKDSNVVKKYNYHYTGQ